MTPPEQAKSPPEAPATILIVEDSPLQTEMLRRALEGAGFHVIAAANGAEGLAMAKKELPAAIVTDINMPVMDGFQMCLAIRSEEALDPTPIIILTMLSDPEDLIRGLNNGADGYLTKPYDAATLVARLQALLLNPPTPSPRKERRKVEVKLGEKTYLVDAHGPRILNLLMSTYQNMMLQNKALVAAQSELENLNRTLEQRVQDQTAALRTRERRFRSLIEHASDLVVIISAAGTVSYVSPSIKRLGGYEIDEVLGTDFLPYAHPEDQASVTAELAALLRDPAQPRGSEVRFRRKDGTWVVLESIARNELADPAINGLIVNARDITERKRADTQILLQMSQLEQAFVQTVEVATNLSGMRDPYIASHQHRVADLAMTIGAELGLNARQQEGLRITGLLHDIGKITIPAEILSKPGKLASVEFKLIQEHVRAGHEVLKNVSFASPVAQTVLQHHERMDGSGYPQGLAGEAILLEARIMAVADVVEAMSSHRPHRAALGIDAALAEIESGSGQLYDAQVADACLKLFRERGYVIPA